MGFLNTITSSFRAITTTAPKAHENASVPTSSQMLAQHIEPVKQSTSDAFAKFDRSIDDISAAVMGKPNKVMSRVEVVKTEVKGTKMVRFTCPPVMKEVTLTLSNFIENPRNGEQESRNNNSLRTVIASLAKIEEEPALPGHEELAASGGRGALLNRVVCTDDAGPITLRSLQNKDTAKRVEEKLSEERSQGISTTQINLGTLMSEIRAFGRAHYLRDSDAPLDLLQKRLTDKQRRLSDTMESKDLHGAYGHKGAARDEKEITRLRKEIKVIKDIIFARHHQSKSNTGADNAKLENKGTAQRLMYAIRRRGASNYLKEGEISPLRKEFGRVFSFGSSSKSSTTAAAESELEMPMRTSPAPLMTSPQTVTNAPATPVRVKPDSLRSDPDFVEYVYSTLVDNVIDQQNLPPQQAEELKKRMSHISQQVNMKGETVALVALAYCEKLKEKRPGPYNWSMVVESLMLADIYCNDATYSAKDWAMASGLPLADVIRAKKEALATLEYRLEIGPAYLAKVRDNLDPLKDRGYINALLDFAGD